jgi:hypothetical protein
MTERELVQAILDKLPETFSQYEDADLDLDVKITVAPNMAGNIIIAVVKEYDYTAVEVFNLTVTKVA